MKYKRILALVLCLMLIFVLTGAKKSKKNAPARSSKETAELKEKVSALESQNAALTAKVTSMETELKNVRKQADTKFLIAASAAGVFMLILAIIAVAGAGKGGGDNEEGHKKKKGAATGAEKHFEDIEYHVLNDWQNIWFHPENIDMKLYDDLKNHFDDLYNQIEEWKGKNHKREELVGQMNKLLAAKFNDIESTPSIYMLVSEDASPFVEENEIKAGPYLCAVIKQGYEGTQGRMTAFYDEITKMFSKNPYSEIRDLNLDITGLKTEIDVKIRKIKFVRNMPGSCGYMNG